VGILLILTGSMAVKNEIVTFFFIGLAAAGRPDLSDCPGWTGSGLRRETVLSGGRGVAAVVQLTAARSFGTSQVFMVLLIIGRAARRRSSRSGS